MKLFIAATIIALTIVSINTASSAIDIIENYTSTHISILENIN